METIELQQTLPEVFSGRDSITSDVWHRQVAFQRGKTYLIEAVSGTGKSSLCSFIYGYRKDYQGIICFDGENVKNFPVRRWVDIRKRSLSMLFQELRLFPELTAWENVQLKNSLTGYCKRSQVEEWLSRLGIADKWDQRIGKCRSDSSKGLRLSVPCVSPSTLSSSTNQSAIWMTVTER